MDMTEWVKGVEAKLEAAGLDAREAKAIALDFEQKSARRGDSGGGETATLGSQFTEAKSAEMATMAQTGERGRISFQTKSTLTSAAGSAGLLAVPQREQLVGMPQRRLTIRNLLTVVDVTSGSVEYPRQVTRPSAAAMVAEGDLKPESSMTFELKRADMKVIAHWIPASRQILDDAPQLKGTIDTELLYGLGLKEETQLLFGDGTGQNLPGMATVATPFAPPVTIAGATMIDNIGLSILQATLTDVPVDGVVVHPSDWWRMRLTKDTQGKYLLGDPGLAVTPSLFGLPLVPTPSMTIDKFLVGGFKAQTLYDRWQARVEVSTEHADFFVRNLVAILAEERIGLANKRPEALIYGDFGNVP